MRPALSGRLLGRPVGNSAGAPQRAGRQVEVGFQMHYAPVYQYVREHLADPEVGELRGAWVQKYHPSYWREPDHWQNRIETMGGTLLDCCIHEMDILLYLLQRPWRRVFVSGRQFLDGPPERDTPDAAVVLVDLRDGLRITLDFLDSHAYCYVRTGIVGAVDGGYTNGRHGLLPRPKWQDPAPARRLSTPQIIQELRKEVWGYALGDGENFDRFVTMATSDTRPPELPANLASAVLYGAMA